METFLISDVYSCIYCEDKRGKRDFVCRRSAGFILTFSGEILFSSAAGAVRADAATAVFLPRGISYRNECLRPAQSVVINFCSDFGADAPLALAAVPRETALGICRRIRPHLHTENPYDRLFVLSEVYALAYRLFGGLPSAQPEHNDARAVYAYLLQNFDKKIKVEALAAAFSMSSVCLQKRFRAAYGKSIYRALCEIRMQRACELLEEKRPVGEIAQSVGYEDIYSFSRAFKRLCGAAPSVYR
ncbi:MAG: helix-turn-helix transcriptional regulator [Clostridia bacterium]|nr:helix-turn-helix transcriptional regulator [Clostridia bacterium]